MSEPEAKEEKKEKKRREKRRKRREYRRRLAIEREAEQLAAILAEEHAALLREKVQERAEALRCEVGRNAHHRTIALDAIDRLAHYVIQLAPPSAHWARRRIEDERSRGCGAAVPGEPGACL